MAACSRAARRRVARDSVGEILEARPRMTSRHRQPGRARSPGLSHSAPDASTGSRWSIWTTPPPRRSRRPSSTPSRGFYTSDCANVHRGVHLLSERATDGYEAARGKVQRFLNAADVREIIFVRGTTEGINLVAQSFGRAAAGRRRRGAHLGHGAPLEHRPLADALRARRAHAARGPDQRPRRADARRVRAAARPAHAVRRGDARLERARHHQPRAPDDRDGARPRRARC